MNALHTFLVFWSWFTSTHSCQVFVPDAVGNGNHVIYGGGCTDAMTFGQHVHGIVTWAGQSQGSVNFGG
jgi:hypothetical protein